MHFQYIQPVTSIESLKTSRSAVLLARGYTGAAQIFRKCRNQLKIPGARRVTWTRLRAQDPANVGRHRTKFSCAGHLERCTCAPLVSVLSWSSVWCHISCSLIAASWTQSRYVVSLLMFRESQPRQPTSPSEPCILCIVCRAVSFC
jgi:hypothetical protein